MNWYATIKRYYDKGIYVTDQDSYFYIGQFVELNKITPEEYREITGTEYEE